MRDLLADLAALATITAFSATFYLWAAYLAEKV